MSRIKQTMCETLATLIESRIPALAGKVFAQWADEEVEASYPSVVVLPTKLTMDPFQDDEVDDTDPNVIVVSVGDFDGDMELRVYAKSSEERSAIADKVQSLFFEVEGRVGVIVAQTPPMSLPLAGTGGDAPALYSATASFMLDDDAWREEMVFSKKRFDFMTLTFQMPILVARQIYTMERIGLFTAIKADLSAPSYPNTYEETDVTEPAEDDDED